MLLGVTIIAAVRAVTPVVAQERYQPLAVDELLDIASLVGGSPSWSPDGRSLMFSSAGRLVTLDVADGSMTPVSDNVAGAGHFLAANMPSWSPDGSRIAYISDRTGHAEIWVLSLRDGSETQLTKHGARINSFSWSPDGGLIAYAGNRYGGFDVYTVSLADGDTHRLTDHTDYEVYPSWTPDGGKLLYVRLDPRWVDHDVIEVDPDDGNPRVVVRDENWFDYGMGSKFGFPQSSPDGELILFPSYRSGWINYWVVPRSGGTPRQVAPAAADQTGGLWSPDGRHIAYVENHDGTHELRIASISNGDVRVLVRPPDGMGVVSNPAWSPDGTRLSYTAETPTRPRDLYVVDVESGEQTRLTNSMEGKEGTEQRLIRPQKVRYTSNEGLEIPAYLYVPPSMRDGDAYPALVWTHGGPTSQYNDTFHENVQFFAQRGYVVLLPNIRGSSGYGRGFEDANNSCWGHCDLEDVVAGAEYLKTLPFVDAARLGTTGSSYGGFMTCAAIAFAPGVFQAAVASSGYCNRVEFVDEGELRHVQQLAYEFGPFDGNEQVYRRNSPYFAVPAVRTPTFLLHGKGRYPNSPQMEEFARHMQREYKVFRYKTYPDENYYVRGRSNRRQMYNDMLAFFDFYLREKDVSLPGVTYVEERW